MIFAGLRRILLRLRVWVSLVSSFDFWAFAMKEKIEDDGSQLGTRLRDVN